MFRTIRRVISFMSSKEKIRFSVYLFLRAIVGIFDLIGILVIGLLATSIALFVTEGSNPNRVLHVGQMALPAVNAASLNSVAMGILFLFMLKTITSLILTKRLALFLARIEARSAKVITENVFAHGLENARKHSMEEIVFAIQVGSPNSFNFLLNSFGTLVAEGFLFILVFGAFLFVNPATALTAILYFGVIGLFIQFFIGRLVEKAGKKISKSTIDANEAITDLGAVIRETSILGKSSYFSEKIYSARLSAASNAASQFVLAGLPRYVIETALAFGIGAFLLIVSINGDIENSAATLGIFLSGALRLIASMLPLQSALLTIKQAIATSAKTLELLETPKWVYTEVPAREEPQGAMGAARISVKNMSFYFEGAKEPAINDVSFEIVPGSQAAFIGPSGAGKSTLADILLGLLEPTKGSIRINDAKPGEIMKLYGGVLGYVPQKPGLISGTIEQNIALGVEPFEIDQVRLEAAISDAHLSSLIQRLPNGVKTNIGKRKDELSGGQLQRIGLARALYFSPRLLVMDEATSALDAESEAEINSALDQLRGSTTVILIAHRLNTIQKSDEVFFMENGSISDSGTFIELLNKNPQVRKLANLMTVRK